MAELIEELSDPSNVLLIDCLTEWLRNILENGRDVMSHLVELISSLENVRGSVILAANEACGCDGNSINKRHHNFCDDVGKVNSAVASVATDVMYMTAGLPMCLKKDGQSSYQPISLSM